MAKIEIIPEPKGIIHIEYDEDLSKPPTIKITGKVTHREILALNYHVLKAFKAYMADERRKLDEEKQLDEGETNG